MLAAGNSDGDIAMLQMSRFGLLIHHDDGKREFEYHAGAEEALAEEAKRNWTIVSMKADFTTVF